MTFHTIRPAVLRLGVAAAALAAMSGFAAAAGHAAAAGRATTSVEAAALPPGSIHSGTGIADGRMAHDALLRPADFPAGWDSTPQPSRFVRTPCSRLNGATTAADARAVSPDFAFRDLRTADNTAYIYSSAGKATHWFNRLSSRDNLACLARVLREGVAAEAAGQGVTVSPVRVQPIIYPPFGDQHAASRLTLTVSSHTVTIEANVDIVFVRAGRGVMTFSFGQVAESFDPTLERQLVNRVTHRLSGDLAISR